MWAVKCAKPDFGDLPTGVFGCRSCGATKEVAGVVQMAERNYEIVAKEVSTHG